MTWAKLQAVGLGEIGLTPRALWRLTWAEFCLLLAGHYHRIAQANEAAWHQTRTLGAWTYSAMGADPTPQPEDLLTLPGDAVRAAAKARQHAAERAAAIEHGRAQFARWREEKAAKQAAKEAQPTPDNG